MATCWGWFFRACGGDVFSAIDGVGFAASRVFPLSFLQYYQSEEFVEVIKKSPDWLFTMTSVFSLVCTLLLFFIGLALRNKFRVLS